MKNLGRKEGCLKNKLNQEMEYKYQLKNKFLIISQLPEII